VIANDQAHPQTFHPGYSQTTRTSCLHHKIAHVAMEWRSVIGIRCAESQKVSTGSGTFLAEELNL
jgi:hypothetical protein